MATKQSSAQAYPLDWPQNMPRNRVRVRARFGDHTVKQCVDAIRGEVGRLNARYLVISSNIPLKADGYPYSDPGKIADPGIAIYFHLDGKPYAMPCDKWDTVENNLWAASKNIEAMRGMLRWGVGSVAQQFAGFKALEATNAVAWWDVLGCGPEADKATIQEKYRQRARAAHPDTGGSSEEMARLNAARDAALAKIAQQR